MAGDALNVLFVCTGNSARSIIAEGLLNHLGGARVRAWSAGSQPKGAVHPLALAVLAEHRSAAHGFRSKSWDEFAAPGAPPVHVVITVCDNAAGESCPVWPGRPITAHWGVPDPAAVDGSDEQKLAAFRGAARVLRRRIELMLALSIDKPGSMAQQQQVRDIGAQ